MMMVMMMAAIKGFGIREEKGNKFRAPDCSAVLAVN